MDVAVMGNMQVDVVQAGPQLEKPQELAAPIVEFPG